MLDWKKIVRERLGTLPLDPGREEEVIEELSQQLEAAYEEELARGTRKTEAIRRSMAQFDDWEKLRNELSKAVAGAPLPIWQQRGILSPRCPLVWAALILSLAFLALFGFRQALVAVSVPFALSRWGDHAFSAQTLSRIERQAVSQADSNALAFVALHHPDMNEAARAAEKAIALDSRLTWISARFARAYPPGHDPAPSIARLKAWDPDNSFPYLLEADVFFDKHWLEPEWQKRNPLELRRALAAAGAWSVPMEKAFAVAKYDSYSVQRFALHRAVLQQQGWDRPDLLMFAAAAQRLPSLLAIRTYADLVENLGDGAASAGHTEEAMAQYRSVAEFGIRMQRASTVIERLVAMSVREESYKHLLPLLRQQGYTQDVFLFESAQTDLREAVELIARTRRLEEPAATRAAHLVLISGGLVLLFGLSALVWLGSVILLRWRENASSLLNRFAAVAGIAPPLLLLACLSLYGAYYPYVRHISQLESLDQFHRDLMPFWGSLVGQGLALPLYRGSWLTMLFWPTLWCVVVLVIGAIALRFVAKRREDGGLHDE